MLTKGLRDEENERINNILKKLITLVYVPENWNETSLEDQLKELGLSFQSLLSFDSDELVLHLQKFHFDWSNSEQFADFLVSLSLKKEENRANLAVKSIAVYDYIQKESKTFSFEIFNKTAAVKATL